jgi:hypothetical protein
MINIKLGIIYYVDELTLHNKLDYIEYIKISNHDDIILTNKPTLIIGWNIVKEKFNNINILNKNINNLYYWTFSIKEKNKDYIFDINKFVTSDILNIFKFYEYRILSPVFNTELTTIDKYISFFEDCELNSIFVSKDLQLSVLCNNEIYRINLKELKYFNIESKELLKFLREKYKNFIYDRTGNVQKGYIEYFKGIDENIVTKYIPLFNKVIYKNNFL